MGAKFFLAQQASKTLPFPSSSLLLLLLLQLNHLLITHRLRGCNKKSRFCDNGHCPKNRALGQFSVEPFSFYVGVQVGDSMTCAGSFAPLPSSLQRGKGEKIEVLQGGRRGGAKMG